MFSLYIWCSLSVLVLMLSVLCQASGKFNVENFYCRAVYVDQVVIEILSNVSNVEQLLLQGQALTIDVCFTAVISQLHNELWV